MKRMFFTFLAVVLCTTCTITWFIQQTRKLTNVVPTYQQNRQFEITTLQANGSVFKIPNTFEETRHMNSHFNLERLNSYLHMNVTDTTNFLSEKLTEVSILPNQVPLRVGNYFKVRIRLFHVDGKPVDTGGDYLRIWLKHSIIKSANINGHVVDHGNGSYTGVVLLPWTGHSEVIVSIANSRHHIALIMKYLEEHGTLNQMTSKFKDSTGKHEENSVCSPKPDVVLKGCNFVDRCNSTQYNYGLPWFCCKPKSEFITCDDIKTQASTKETSLSELAIKVSKQKHMKVTNIKMLIRENGGLSRLLSPSMTCSDREPRATWLDNSPPGYLYNRNWINLKCKTETINFKTCLKNKRVVSLGDSNNRAVYQVMISKINAVEVTKRSNNEAPWHKLLEAKNVALNVDLMWAPHNPPFYVGDHQSLDTMRSVGYWLDRTPNDKPIIVIIHLYYHLTRTTLSVFRALVKDARAAVDRLLKRAPDSKVIIQGPHSMTYSEILEPLDFLLQCHEEIWFQEFRGLHDKVLYINNWDRTAGMENEHLHVDFYVSVQFTNEMLTYLCG